MPMYTNNGSIAAGSVRDNFRALLILGLVSLLMVGCDSSGSSSSTPAFDPELAQTFETVLVNNMQEYDVPGALVGVWIPGQGELILAEGVSDLDTSDPLDIEDHMRVGSVTKSFTVTVILQLVEEGLLDLDDPISRFFPDLQNNDATIADLANMRGGIFNYTEDADFVALLVEDFLRVWLPQEIVDVARRNAPYFSPDGGWHYSNTSTVMLGMIVEQLTGNPVGDEIQQRIIAPLELGGTLYPTSPDMPAPFSRGYLGPADDLMDITFTDPSSSAASGAMISRLLDLRKWAEALGKGTLLTEEIQKERLDSLAPIVFDPCDDSDPDRAPRSCPEYDRYGFGLGEISGWIGHTGEGLGYTVLVMFEPESAAVIVVMMNRSGAGEHVPTMVFREYVKALQDTP